MIKKYEFRTETIVDSLILFDFLKEIKTTKSFMMYKRGRYFKLSIGD